MRICVAQTLSTKGDIENNILKNLKFIQKAISYKADLIIFPELSLSNYEPELAQALAITPEDKRLEPFQECSNNQQITIGVGVPLKNDSGVSIGLIIFRPNQPQEIYLKKYLHPDEEPYFIPGINTLNLLDDKNKVALAICYEISVPEHAEMAFTSGANIYIASVAKSASGLDKAFTRLGEIAQKYNLTVFMANCLGPCDNFIGGGKTAVWNNQGHLVGQLNDTTEGLLILDTNTQELILKYL